jgi:ribonuclease P protein subunit POP4
VTVTPENILYHELVGLQVTIQAAHDSTLEGVSGRIVSESRNMITVETVDSRTTSFAKKVARKIKLETDSGVCFISGSSLIGKPEDRLARLH